MFVGSVDIDCGSKLYSDLVMAQQSLVIAGPLHLLYLSTPYDMVTDIKPNWMIYLHEASTQWSFCVCDSVGMSYRNFTLLNVDLLTE